MKIDYKLISNDKLTALIKHSGIETWNELIEFTKNLPYGRNSNRTEFELVISEQKGSCSSKHAFLKKVAELNKIQHVKLILCIYRMNHKNTPNIGNELSKNSIEFIPEAHCYLIIDDVRTDITTHQAVFDRIEMDIIEEVEIMPEQVAAFKVDYHKQYLRRWISEYRIEKNLDEIWEIREKCISRLARKPM